MDFEDLATDRLNDAAAHFAAGEALRRTRHRVELTFEENRWKLRINGHLARVFGRRLTTPRPLRRGSGQDVTGAHSLVFVDFSDPAPRFHITPPDVASGQVGQWLDRWDRFDTPDR